MNNVTEHILLAARNEDINSWVNILVIVVLAVFWAIGGILKSKAKNTDDEDHEEPGHKPSRKPSNTVNSLKEAFFQQLRQVHPAVPAQRKKTIHPQTVNQRPTSKKSVYTGHKFPKKQEVQPGIDERMDFIGEPIKGVIDKSVKERPKAETESVLEAFIDYADTDELRRAILHYEILGKPLSLRETSLED